jgi:hypothetical protein
VYARERDYDEMSHISFVEQFQYIITLEIFKVANAV